MSGDGMANILAACVFCISVAADFVLFFMKRNSHRKQMLEISQKEKESEAYFTKIRSEMRRDLGIASEERTVQ